MKNRTDLLRGKKGSFITLPIAAYTIAIFLEIICFKSSLIMALHENLGKTELTVGNLLTMTAISSAIMLFLYGRLNEKVYGLKTEDVIKKIIGKNVLIVQRYIALALPPVGFITIASGYHFLSIFITIHLYIIIIVLVILVYRMMNIDEFVKKVAEEDYRKRKDDLKRILRIEYGNGYLIQGDNRKFKVVKKEEIYSKLLGEHTPFVFGKTSGERELYRILFQSYNMVIEDKSDEKEAVFISLYHFTREMLFMPEESERLYDWRYALLRQVLSQIDDLKGKESSGYRVKYLAVACAIISSDNRDAQDFFRQEYLYRMLYDDESAYDFTDVQNDFVYIIKFIELVYTGQAFDKNSFYPFILSKRKIIEKNLINYYKENYEDNLMYSFLLSILCYKSQSNIERVFRNIDKDIGNIKKYKYASRTFFGTIISFI